MQTSPSTGGDAGEALDPVAPVEPGDPTAPDHPAEKAAALPRRPFQALSAAELDDRLASLPARPGCYIFRDQSGGVLYVGKAKSLRSRVRSYFASGGSDDRAFLPMLRRLLGGVETLVTDTEKEAAILENSLIKESRPRFNVKLRDDKEFLTLRLDETRAFPRLELVRRPEADGSRYFGPYHSASAARRSLHVVEKHFQLRTCTDREMAARRRPCLQYQIKRCSGPCVYEVDRELYTAQVKAVALFLDGRHDELSLQLGTQMQQASARLEFELAATYRDQLRALESIQQQQRVVMVTDRDQEVFAPYREGDIAEVAVLTLRAGRVVHAATFSQKRLEIPDEEIIAGCIREHYAFDGLGANVPDEVIVPTLPEGAEGVAEWLTERRADRQGVARRVRLIAPSRGPRSELLRLALDNARHAFAEKKRADEDIAARLGRVQARLRLPHLPRQIECIDISHLGGQDTYGSIVALSDGAPNKKRYRSFRVKSVDGGDDYGAMFEVLSRRFTRATSSEDEGGSADWQLPDLLVVDGGRGQLGVALAAAADLGLHELPIVGLAKEKENVAGDKLVDRVYLPGQKNPVNLSPNAPELFLLALARDEAHRFANRSRERAGKKRRLGSALDRVPGIGPKTRASLLRHVGGPLKIRAASDAQLLEVPGIGPTHVRSLREHLGSEELGAPSVERARASAAAPDDDPDGSLRHGAAQDAPRQAAPGPAGEQKRGERRGPNAVRPGSERGATEEHLHRAPPTASTPTDAPGEREVDESPEASHD